jgi:hypothetical protein
VRFERVPAKIVHDMRFDVFISYPHEDKAAADAACAALEAADAHLDALVICAPSPTPILNQLADRGGL